MTPQEKRAALISGAAFAIPLLMVWQFGLLVFVALFAAVLSAFTAWCIYELVLAALKGPK